MYYQLRFIIFTPILVSLLSAQILLSDDRPDLLRLEAESIPSESPAATDTPDAQMADVVAVRSASSTRRKKARRLPRRSKKLRKMLGVSGERFSTTYPTINGQGNNEENTTWGRTGMPFNRMCRERYEDGVSEPMSEGLSSARAISNSCFDQIADSPSKMKVSDYLWQWGQFLDHDITHTPTMKPEELFMISIPAGDRFFDPRNEGSKEMKLERSAYRMIDGVRQQVNIITAFIDASNVYGSDDERARDLRAFDGKGRLRVSDGKMLPLNVNGLSNAPTDHDPSLFIAGDFRANEQVGLTAMHTLFVREHNYWAKFISRAFPRMSGNRVYQIARSIVTAEMQVITYNEFLPLLLGEDAIGAYQGYKSDVDPTISNEFATAAFRFGHSMLSPHLLRVNAQLEPTAEGPLLLREAFFQPQRLVTEGGIEPVLRGLAVQPAQEVDMKIIDDVRNFLFGPPGSGGFDLASLNIQRTRDHGLASLNQARVDLKLDPVTEFSQLSDDPKIVECLSSMYESPDQIDLWVGGLAEDHAEGAMLGETFKAILADQFIRLRDGDRFWYENYLPEQLQKMVRKQTLAKIIRRNTSIKREISDNVFLIQ